MIFRFTVLVPTVVVVFLITSATWQSPHFLAATFGPITFVVVVIAFGDATAAAAEAVATASVTAPRAAAIAWRIFVLLSCLVNGSSFSFLVERAKRSMWICRGGTPTARTLRTATFVMPGGPQT